MSEKYAFWITLRPQSDRCRRGEAEVRILDFKTTWSEFQKANQTATEQGNAERISNQNVCSPPQIRSQAVVCISTPRKYPRSGYFLVTYCIQMTSQAHFHSKCFATNVTFVWITTSNFSWNKICVTTMCSQCRLFFKSGLTNLTL